MQNLSAPVSEKVAQVVNDYYHQIDRFSLTIRDLADWYIRLSIVDGTHIAVIPLSSWYNLFSFKRYFLEKHGYLMPAYMAEHLTPQELPHWIDDRNGGLPPN